MSRRSFPRRPAAQKQKDGGIPVGVRPRFPETLFMLPPEAEYVRLWKHVVFGTGTCVGMIEGYTRLNMPGLEISELYALRDRLNAVIATQEAKHGRA